MPKDNYTEIELEDYSSIKQKQIHGITQKLYAEMQFEGLNIIDGFNEKIQAIIQESIGASREEIIKDHQHKIADFVSSLNQNAAPYRNGQVSSLLRFFQSNEGTQPEAKAESGPRHRSPRKPT